uniref:Uncharacterized protein n=1 Tax=Emiliania huxleyi (strain CCMP1516) TaxID=280463 RepID=A0A0D3IAV8_EMIH1
MGGGDGPEAAARALDRAADGLCSARLEELAGGSGTSSDSLGALLSVCSKHVTQPVVEELKARDERTRRDAPRRAER